MNNTDHVSIEDDLREIIANQLNADPACILPDTNLRNDLGMDSLDVIELVICIQDHFRIVINESEEDKIFSLNDLINLVQSLRK